MSDNEQSAAAVTLLGSGIGLLGGNLLASHQHYTRGDAHVLSAVGLLGAYIPLALVDSIDPEADRAYSAASMLGAIVGLGLGHQLLMGKDFSTDQGNLIRLSELAGGMLGLGIAYLVSSEDADNSALYLAGSATGATGGFWLMYRSYARSAHKSQNSFLGNIKVIPEGLIALAMGNKISSAQKAMLHSRTKCNTWL